MHVGHVWGRRSPDDDVEDGQPQLLAAGLHAAAALLLLTCCHGAAAALTCSISDMQQH